MKSLTIVSLCAGVLISACSDSNDPPPRPSSSPCQFDPAAGRNTSACIDACFAAHGLPFTVTMETFLISPDGPGSLRRKLSPVTVESVQPPVLRTFDLIAVKGEGFGSATSGVAGVIYEMYWSTTSEVLDPTAIEEVLRQGGRRGVVNHGVEVMTATTLSEQTLVGVFRTFLAKLNEENVLQLVAADGFDPSLLRSVIDALAYDRYIGGTHTGAPPGRIIDAPAGLQMWVRVRRLANCAEREFITWSEPVSSVWLQPVTTAAEFQEDCEMFDTGVTGDISFCDALGAFVR